MATKICNCPPEIKSKCPCKECSSCSAKLFDGFTRCSMIMASAGTGKTYSLAMRYLQLLLFGVTPQEILAVTFTRKASGGQLHILVAMILFLLPIYSVNARQQIRTQQICHFCIQRTAFDNIVIFPFFQFIDYFRHLEKSG